MLFWRKTRRKSEKEARPAAGKSALTREIAGIASDLNEPLAGFMGTRPNRDPLLASQSPASQYAYPYGLFEEALDKDAHLSAAVSQRKAAVLAWERQLVPADDSTQARVAHDLVEQALAGISRAKSNGTGGFEHDMAELLEAIPYGIAVSEVIWEQHGESLLPAALLARHPRRFTFTSEGGLRLLTATEPVEGEALPDRKFLVFAPYGRHENPYGLPALRCVWWLAYFKRQVMKFWVMFAEKFGSPTTVLKHPLGATDKEKAAYRRIIGSIQQETGLVVPDGVDLALLEATRGGSVNTYSELIELCNREISKALLGQTLTMEPGERGARSLGEVHLQVREDIVRQDARALECLVNGRLIPWIVDLNLPASQRKYPRWELTPPKKEDLALQLEIDRFFADQGLELDQAQLYERYGRKTASATEETNTDD